MRSLPRAAALALLLCASCKKLGDPRTVDVAADAPGTASAPARVQLVLSAGSLRMTPGGVRTVGGGVRSNCKDLDPTVDAVADRIQITQGAAGSDAAKLGGDVLADWRLTLSSAPMGLSIDAGAASTSLELGGLAVKSLHVTSTTGPVALDWNAPNAMAADDVFVEVGSGAVTLTGLGAFGASTGHVHTGVGAITVDVGRVDRDVTLELEATQGEVKVRVPANVTARATVAQSAAQLTATGWTKDGDAWTLGGPTPSPRVTIHAKNGGAPVTLAVGG